MKSVLGQGAVQPGGSNLLGSALKGLTSTWASTKKLQTNLAYDQVKNQLLMDRKTHENLTRAAADYALEEQKQKNKMDLHSAKSEAELRRIEKESEEERTTHKSNLDTEEQHLKNLSKGIYAGAGVEAPEGSIIGGLTTASKIKNTPGFASLIPGHPEYQNPHPVTNKGQTTNSTAANSPLTRDDWNSKFNAVGGTLPKLHTGTPYISKSPYQSGQVPNIPVSSVSQPASKADWNKKFNNMAIQNDLQNNAPAPTTKVRKPRTQKPKPSPVKGNTIKMKSTTTSKKAPRTTTPGTAA
jgi:hypothetical protein